MTWSNDGASGSISCTAYATTEGGEGFALFAGGLIPLIEHAQQLRMGGEHAGIEVGGDLVGMRSDDGRGGPNHAERLIRQ